MYHREITRTHNREWAEHFKRIMDGQSYFNFQVLICPDGGEFSVVVESAIGGREQEADDMLMMLMADAIMLQCVTAERDRIEANTRRVQDAVDGRG